MVKDKKQKYIGSSMPKSDLYMKYMSENWAGQKSGAGKRRFEKIENATIYANRRQSISKHFTDDMLVIACGHEKQRSNDTVYRFRPSSDFYYLTGCEEEGSILVMKPTGSGHESILFVRGEGYSDGSSFTDRAHGELWVGARIGVAESKIYFGVDHAFSLNEFQNIVDVSRDNVRILGDVKINEGALPENDAFLEQALSELRLMKDPYEISELKAAVKSTKRGFEDVIHTMKEACSEREIEIAFESRARLEGNGTGYNTIAASGANACTLHWIRNDAKVKSGQLLLLDAGVERKSHYTADVTRTLPISGSFSKDQAAIYDLVNSARLAALSELRPGANFSEPHIAATKVLVNGLVSLGILRISAEDAIKNQWYRRYTLHGTSHMLGLDVHDCAKARSECYHHGTLKPGMVFTIEPGLYFQPGDLTVPEKYRGIGVRIEDDIVITKSGHLNLSADIPSDRKDVEAWIKGIWKRKK